MSGRQCDDQFEKSGRQAPKLVDDRTTSIYKPALIDLWSNDHVSTIRASHRQGQQNMKDQRTNLQRTILIVQI